jgi:hypothetical protein
VPVNYRTYIGTLLLFADASTMTLLVVYFRFISKEWVYFQGTSLILNLISVIFIAFVPESPKYYHGKGMFE